VIWSILRGSTKSIGVFRNRPFLLSVRSGPWLLPLGAVPSGMAVVGCRVIGGESVAWLGGLPVVGEQFFEAAGRMVGNAGDEAARARRSDKRCPMSPSRREGA
jgi:hypothetical protein